MKKKPAVKKITDLKDKLDAYRASALAAGNGRSKGLARPGPGNLALASAAAGGAALAIAPAAEATIVYSGVRDIMLTATSEEGFDYRYTPIYMDENDDVDFYRTHLYIPEEGFGAIIYPEGEYAGIIKYTTGKYTYEGFNPIPVAKPLSANYNIANITNSGANGFWYSRDPAALGLDNSGPFPDGTNKFIGVRFTNEDGEHFGWIRVNLAANSTSIKIVDWAYEDDVDKAIPAGKGASVVPTLNDVYWICWTRDSLIFIVY